MVDNKRRFIMSSENDRISNLPELLIDLIFERLPFQDVVKTSILSKKWRYKWTKMKALVADEQFSKKFAKYGAFGQHGFIRIINLVLLLHEGPISKFDLCIPYNIFLDSFQEIDRWMLLLSRKGVRDLAVVNLNKRYQLLSYLFSCLQLRKLKLVNCFFYPPSKLQEFPYLEKLFLKNIDFGAKLNEIVINLPQLKSLVLHRCTNVDNFNIKATKLQKLMVDASPKLLTFLHNKFISVFCTFICKPVENLVGVERMSLTRILSNISNIQRFIFDGLLMKSFIAEKTPKWLPHEVNSLWQLELLEFELGDLSQLECALCLLQNTPNLKVLKMTHVQMEPQDINYDVGPASNHSEPPYCLDQTFNQLQTVEIKSLRGLRPELLFIKLLLAHSPSLEKLTIQPSQTCDAIKRLDIAVDIMRFPRASPKAEVVFLNSDP